MAQELAKVLYHYGYIDGILYDKIKIICPFHQDLKPSMLANLVTDRVYCFGCPASTDTIGFIKQKEKCDDLYAYAKLAEIMANPKIRNVEFVVKPKLTNKEAISDAKHYFYTLPETDWHKQPKDSYLLNRGFSPGTLNKLDVRENFNHIYGVIMPMLDMGKFRGYVCRATVESDRKYLYNIGFSRTNTLVGEYNKPWPIITEGYLDYARLVQFGVRNSAAILGWKATDRQISKLQKYTNCIISALDNTPTGKDGTEYLRQFFHVIRFQFPKHRKDIGEIAEHEWGYAWNSTKRLVHAYTY